MKLNKSPVHLPARVPLSPPTLTGPRGVEPSLSRPMSPGEQFGLMRVGEEGEPSSRDIEVCVCVCVGGGGVVSTCWINVFTSTVNSTLSLLIVYG